MYISIEKDIKTKKPRSMEARNSSPQVQFGGGESRNGSGRKAANARIGIQRSTVLESRTAMFFVNHMVYRWQGRHNS